MNTAFESERIRFVRVSEELIKDYLIMINDDDNVNIYLTKRSKAYTEADEIRWVREKLEENAPVFSMLEKESGSFIGNIELMDPDGTSAELGIAITADKQNRGYGTEAVSFIVQYGFRNLGLKKILLKANPENLRAIHVYEKCGFREYDRNDRHVFMVINRDERFCFEVPSEKRKDEAIEFIQEFYRYGSEINGTGGLHRYLDDYEGWLEKLEADYTRIPDENKVPARTYFLIRENDDRIIGMINIRLALNERLRKFGGNIGYSIRPTERGKGYNTINLYLGLKVCKQYGIDTVLLDADLNNPASWKTMEALGGKRIREYYDDSMQSILVDYTIDVRKALEEHREYEAMVVYDN